MRILMPCAGLYKRYPPNGMPKYIRPLNDMRPMFQWALDGVRKLTDKKICFAVRKENEYEWHVSEIIKIRENAEVMILEKETDGPADTVYQMLKHFNINEPFLVHDCDCTWNSILKWDINNNCIAVGWRETAIGDRGSKSWIINDKDMVSSIEEKKSIHDWYCCGGYQFRSPELFCRYFEEYRDKYEEFFCSHIIQLMINDGEKFNWLECDNLNDWGTFEKYVDWRKQKKVYFFDLDGTITEAGAPYGKNTWDKVKVLEGVKNKIDKLKEDGAYIIIVSSRSQEIEKFTYDFLKFNGIKFDNLLFGIPNGTRVMINDYAESNPYPVVEAINTKRNSADWVDML